MKRHLLMFVGILAILLIMLNVIGCSNGADPGDEVEVVELTFAHPFPATHHHHVDIIEPFVKEIMEKSEGRIKINVHPGSSITTGTSAIDDISSGAVDMTWTLLGYTPGRFPLTEMFEFFGHFTSGEEATKVAWALLEQSEAYREEFKDFKIFNFYFSDVSDVYLATKPVRTPDDLVGVKLRSASPMVDRSLAKFGATTAGMPMPDAYDNIKLGVVEGLATGASAIPTYRLTEVLKYGTEGMNLYVSPQVMAISWDAWNKLSPADQELIETIGCEMLSIKSGKYYDDLHDNAVNTMEEEGMEIYRLTDEDRALFAEKAAPVVDEYIAELEAKGYAAREFYELMISIRDSLRNQ